MATKWLETRQKVITYSRKLQAERLVYSTAGNISMRIPGHPELLACTPTGSQYDLLEPDKLLRKYVGRDGAVVGIATFGESAPAKDLYAHFGLTAQRIGAEVRRVIAAPHRRAAAAEAVAAA